MSKPDDQRYTIAVDFDGVIHRYASPWVDAWTIPDAPVEGAIEWLNTMYERFDVVIFTTRGKTDAGSDAVAHWLLRHGANADMVLTMPITATKPPALVYIDDRAWRFEGRFPTAREIHEARPWNKRESVPVETYTINVYEDGDGGTTAELLIGGVRDSRVSGINRDEVLGAVVSEWMKDESL